MKVQDMKTRNIKIRNIEIEDYNAVDNLMQQLHKVHVNGRPDLYTDLEHPYSEQEVSRLIADSNVISILAEENGDGVGI